MSIVLNSSYVFYIQLNVFFRNYRCSARRNFTENTLMFYTRGLEL